jgi:hypothetical protein
MGVEPVGLLAGSERGAVYPDLGRWATPGEERVDLVACSPSWPPR